MDSKTSVSVVMECHNKGMPPSEINKLLGIRDAHDIIVREWAIDKERMLKSRQAARIRDWFGENEY